MTYVAFLRGINSGKNPSIKMSDLKRVFEHVGMENVKTVLASGNVVFDSGVKDLQSLVKILESAFAEEFSFHSEIKIWEMQDLHSLMDEKPFDDYSIKKPIKANVTFLDEINSSRELEFPFSGNGFEILGLFSNDRVVCSIVDTSQASTLDVMKLLDQEFGKKVTTRTWNTLQRIIAK